MERSPRGGNCETKHALRHVDLKFWSPIVSAFLGAASLIAGTFVSSTCTRSRPGENGCIEYLYDLLGRGITVAGLVLLVGGLYVIFAPHFGWPFMLRKP